MDLISKLADLGINLRKPSIGRDLRTLCPQCRGGSDKEESLSVMLDPHGGATWHCFRASCGWKGNIPSVKLNNWQVGKSKTYRRPTPVQDPPRPEGIYEWFQTERAISKETVDTFGCYLSKQYFHKAKGERSCIAFPYYHNRELVGVKYRTKDKQWTQESGTEPTIFNIDNINYDLVPVVEGELDVMALHEAGIPGAITLRDGAPSKDTNLADAACYDAIRTHADTLKDVRHFVLSGDTDEVGRQHMLEIARRLGKERCFLVDWPEGCKDANDTLRQHGKEAVKDAIKSAKPFPIEGLWNISEDDIATLDDESWQVTKPSGEKSLDDLFQLPEQGRLIVVTGIPGMGKSTFADWLSLRMATKYGWRTALFSPETTPWQLHAQRLAQMYIGKPWKKMSVAEKIKAVEFVGNHFTHIADETEEAHYTVDWLIAHIRYAVLRDGIKTVILDPWNEIEHGRPEGMTMTEYTNRELPRLKRLCAAHGINVILVVHPKKIEGDVVPTGYSISDSAAFANKADFGITIHQPSGMTNTVMVKCWKIRFQAHGRKGEAFLKWDPESNRFSSQ